MLGWGALGKRYAWRSDHVETIESTPSDCVCRGHSASGWEVPKGRARLRPELPTQRRAEGHILGAGTPDGRERSWYPREQGDALAVGFAPSRREVHRFSTEGPAPLGGPSPFLGTIDGRCRIAWYNGEDSQTPLSCIPETRHEPTTVRAVGSCFVMCAILSGAVGALEFLLVASRFNAFGISS